MPRKRPSSHSPAEQPTQTPDNSCKKPVPIVGIGASAGGLEAFEQFFQRIPASSGIAFILVPHLDPHHSSMLVEILGRVTKIPVIEAQDQMDVLPDHVYIIPPNREMVIFQGKIQLNIPDPSCGNRMKIDLFLRSLAEEQGDRAIGIIFSGTGTDGTLGLRAILGSGGISYVQDPATAKYDGMPTSAIKSGYATYVLPVDQMPDKVITSVKSLFGGISLRPLVSGEPEKPDSSNEISRILRIIRSRTGHDFSHYKKSTIHRRIDRRMAVHIIAEYAIYTRYLEGHPEEVNILFRELLINVTSFFRDPESYETLKKEVFPELIRKKGNYETFRVWVPGCATGEEAYSLAIMIKEVLKDQEKDVKVQIYATDIAEDVITVARKGVFPPNIAADVSTDRLKMFFNRKENGFEVKTEIREMVIFAVQNVIKDPPFTKLDLLSCRNLLIYLESEIQSRLITAFHYALKPGGILFLSSSESIGSCPDLFKPISRKWKIYESTGINIGVRTMVETSIPFAGSYPTISAIDVSPRIDTNIVELTRMALLQAYAPPSVVTDETGNILYVHGDTGKFLRPAPGKASLSVIEMAREGLELDLRTAIFSARTQKKGVTCNNLQVKTNGGFEPVNLEIRPIHGSDSSQGGLIISFLMCDPPELQEVSGQTRENRSPDPRHGRLNELENELLYTRETLQATVEEMQAANEELKSTNEELQSTNEELQSTNEELETSKEEIQSVNEELLTVNAELQSKIGLLTELQNDMSNLLSSTGIGTIFLDTELAIRRFTPEAAKIYNLVASDVGRPLIDIKSKILQDDLIKESRIVLDSLIPLEKEVQIVDNSWFFIRIMPYRTLDNKIAGVVLTFIDISIRKSAEYKVIRAQEFAENIVDTVREPLLILDKNFSVISANRSYYRTFQTSHSETVGKNLTEIGDHQWDIPSLTTLLKTILPEKTTFEDLEVSHTSMNAPERRLVLNARAIHAKDDGSDLILLAIEEEFRYKNPEETGIEG